MDTRLSYLRLPLKVHGAEIAQGCEACSAENYEAMIAIALKVISLVKYDSTSKVPSLGGLVLCYGVYLLCSLF